MSKTRTTAARARVVALAVGCVASLVGCAGSNGAGTPEPVTSEPTSADAGFPEPGDRLEILEAEVDGERTFVFFVEGVCGGEFEQSVQSDSDSVTVGATLVSHDPGLDCLTPMVLDLSEPLGDRVLIDATTGDEVPVRGYGSSDSR